MRNQDNGGPVFPSVAGTDPRTGETMLASVGISLFANYFAGLGADCDAPDNLDTCRRAIPENPVTSRARAMLA